jgi:hypothetical protein
MPPRPDPSISSALQADHDRTALLAYVWSKGTGHPPDRPIHCAACDALHLRDCLLQLVGLDDSLIVALCDACAELVMRNRPLVEAAIDARGHAGRFCVHLIDQLDGYRFAVADADCSCGRASEAS